MLCEAEGLIWDEQDDPMKNANGDDQGKEQYRHLARALIAHLGGKVE